MISVLEILELVRSKVIINEIPIILANSSLACIGGINFIVYHILYEKE